MDNIALYPNLFQARRIFCTMRLFSNLFSTKPSIFIRKETFCEHRGLLRVVGTMRLTFFGKQFSFGYIVPLHFFKSSWLGKSVLRI